MAGAGGSEQCQDFVVEKRNVSANGLIGGDVTCELVVCDDFCERKVETQSITFPAGTTVAKTWVEEMIAGDCCTDDDTSTRISVDCCPGVTLPASLTATFTASGGSCETCHDGNVLTMEWTGGQYEASTTCGAYTVEFVLECVGETWVFKSRCRTATYTSFSLDSASCDPFSLTFSRSTTSVEFGSLCCSGPGTISVTITGDTAPPRDISIRVEKKRLLIPPSANPTLGDRFCLSDLECCDVDGDGGARIEVGCCKTEDGLSNITLPRKLYLTFYDYVHTNGGCVNGQSGCANLLEGLTIELETPNLIDPDDTNPEYVIWAGGAVLAACNQCDPSHPFDLIPYHLIAAAELRCTTNVGGASLNLCVSIRGVYLQPDQLAIFGCWPTLGSTPLDDEFRGYWGGGTWFDYIGCSEPDNVPFLHTFTARQFDSQGSQTPNCINGPQFHSHVCGDDFTVSYQLSE